MIRTEININITESIGDHTNQKFKTPKDSVIDDLLFEIYDKWAYKCRHDSSWDSDTITSASDVVSSCVWRRSMGISMNGSENEQKQFENISELSLNHKSEEELEKIRNSLKQAVTIFSSKLVRQLKRRDHALVNMQKNCDILTAILQASSLKRREDTKLKFVMEPKPGNEAFRQWCEAMKGVARLPLGLPSEIRKKIMVYLVDHILPESYFAQNLQALSIDMAVFRELLSIHVPKLAIHLNNLQALSQQQNAFSNSNHYEPPLINVFTMQWFLTLFATCLSPDLVLHIWDSIMLEGSEIIFRTGLAIWELLSDRLLKVNDADSFYCTMRDLTSQLSEGCIAKSDQLINRIYNMAPIPFPGLSNLRDRFTYNINPFSSIPSAIVSYGSAGNETGDEAEEDDDYKSKIENISSIGCFGGMIPNNHLLNYKSKENQIPLSLSSVDISQVGPGAVSTSPSVHHTTSPGATQERMCTNLTMLENHYNKIKDKQKKTRLLINHFGLQKNPSQSHIISPSRQHKSKKDKQKTSHIIVNSNYPCLQNSMVNHLFLTRNTAETSDQKPSHIHENSLKSYTLDNKSGPIRKFRPLNIDVVKTQKHIFDFHFMNNLSCYAIPESTISSIRPISDTSTNHLRRSLSQSDLTNSCDDFVTNKAQSLTNLQPKRMTLLQLSQGSQLNYVIKNDLQNQEVSKLINESIVSPDLNFVLEKHHRHIQNSQWSKHLKSEEVPNKMLPIEDSNSPTEFGHTARWVAQHHSQFPYDAMQTQEPNFLMRQSSVPCSSNKVSHSALFGTKFGLYKTMAESRLYRSRINGILHSTYTNELQRSLKCGAFKSN